MSLCDAPNNSILAVTMYLARCSRLNGIITVFIEDSTQPKVAVVIITYANEVMQVFACLFVCLLSILCKNFQTNLHEIFREGWQWANEQTIKFW